MRDAIRIVALSLSAVWSTLPAAAPAGRARLDRPPNILVVTVDTLRVDHMSGFGYERPTTPNLDRLMDAGVRFDQARVVVPLTCPSLASMWTTLEPQLHGSTRNGLLIREGLASLPKHLATRGYRTAAFVSNWTLQDRLCGLAEHFGEWEEVLTRRHWLFSKRVADADDMTGVALDWLERHVADGDTQPFLLWVHYVDPHSPYVLQERYLDQLGLGRAKSAFSLKNRYDSELAYVDHSIGRLLDRFREMLDPAETIVLFTADHGESLGDHGYWGHGRHVYEAGLRIPLAIHWPGRLEPATIEAPALNVDVAPTLLGLAGIAAPQSFGGFDWSAVIHGEVPAPMGRVTYHQGHKGAVEPTEDPRDLRRKGLLEVGRIEGTRKEVLVVPKDLRRIFDIVADPAERESLVAADSAISPDLAAFLDSVRDWLVVPDGLVNPALSDEDLDQLRSLGYID